MRLEWTTERFGKPGVTNYVLDPDHSMNLANMKAMTRLERKILRAYLEVNLEQLDQADVEAEV
jgi:hypothetical protein